jgi:tRNA 2-thiocytidine biosynthesis protein TtcA
MTFKIPCPPWPKIGKKLESLCRKALHDFSMIEKSHKSMCVALSGGKDSLTMLSLLAAIAKRGSQSFQLHAIHVEDAFNSSKKTHKFLQKFCKELQIPLTIVSFPKVSLESLNCYSCSRLRRKVIFETAKELNIPFIAFGHHRDDNIQTLLLNLFHQAEFAAMLPLLPMIHYQVTILRPLIYASEADIMFFAKYYHFLPSTCSCRKGKSTKRKSVEKLLCAIEKEFPHVRNNLALSTQKYGSRKALKNEFSCINPREELLNIEE